jgi:hypothetical protein
MRLSLRARRRTLHVRWRAHAEQPRGWWASSCEPVTRPTPDYFDVMALAQRKPMPWLRASGTWP